MLRKITDKRGQHVIDKLLIWLLALLVLAVVLVFLFYNDIIDWMRDLPGYEGDVEDVEISEADVTTFSEACPIQIGKIVHKYEGIFSQKDYIYLVEGNFLVNTELFIKGDSNYAEIYVSRESVKIKIGEIKEGRVLLSVNIGKDLYDDGTSVEIFKSIENIPFYSKLRRLDNSFLFQNILCKKTEDVEYEKVQEQEIENLIEDRRYSLAVPLYFFPTFRERGRQIVIAWNYEKSKPYLMMGVDEETARRFGEQESNFVDFEKNDNFYNRFVKQKFNSENLGFIDGLFESETPQELAGEIKLIVKSRNAIFWVDARLPRYRKEISIEKIYNLLSGLDYVYETKFKISKEFSVNQKDYVYAGEVDERGETMIYEETKNTIWYKDESTGLRSTRFYISEDGTNILEINCAKTYQEINDESKDFVVATISKDGEIDLSENLNSQLLSNEKLATLEGETVSSVDANKFVTISGKKTCIRYPIVIDRCVYDYQEKDLGIWHSSVTAGFIRCRNSGSALWQIIKIEDPHYRILNELAEEIILKKEGGYLVIEPPVETKE